MLYQLLGFRDSEFPAGLGWHDKMARGFPELSIWNLSRALSVPPDETGFLCGIPRGSLTWKNRKQLVTPGVSACLFRIAVAYHRLFAILKDREVVSNWLRTPRRELGGLTPIVMLASQPGFELVIDTISKIKPPKTVERNAPVEASETARDEDSENTEDPREDTPEQQAED